MDEKRFRGTPVLLLLLLPWFDCFQESRCSDVGHFQETFSCCSFLLDGVYEDGDSDFLFDCTRRAIVERYSTVGRSHDGVSRACSC